LVCIRSYSM